MNSKNGLPLLIIALLGLISIVIPVFFLEDLRVYDSPLFPQIRTGMEGISRYSFLLLFLSGFVVKAFSNLPSWKIGMMSMALFPIAAILEIIADASSHNMLPLEILFYLIYTLPAIAGAYLAQFLKKLLLVRALHKGL